MSDITKQIASDVLDEMFSKALKTVVILNKNDNTFQRPGEISVQVYPPECRGHAELLAEGMNKAKAEGHPFRVVRTVILVDKEGKYD